MKLARVFMPYILFVRSYKYFDAKKISQFIEKQFDEFKENLRIYIKNNPHEFLKN